MSRIFKYVILFSVALSGCQREMEINLSVPFQGQKLVVNSLNNPDSIWALKLTLTRHVFDTIADYFEAPENATVTIIDKTTNTVIDELFQVDTTGLFVGTVKPEVGKHYQVSISAPQYGSAEASSVIPSAILIDKIEIDSSEFKSNFKEPLRVKIYFIDPPATSDYYKINLIQTSYSIFNGDTTWYLNPVYFGFDNLSLDTEDNTYPEREWLSSDALFNGKEYFVTLKIPAIGNDKSVVDAILSHITEDYYLYATTLNLQKDVKSDPFAQPVQVYSNIKNGFGIFGSYSESRKQLKD